MKRFIILVLSNETMMKKVLAFAALIAFLTACSQYTCPTYSKKETKKESLERHI